MVDTLASLAEKFRDLPQHLERNLNAAVHMAGERAAAEAKQNHDYVDRSGTLTASIGLEGPDGSFLDDTLSATLSAGAGYASYVEMGTRPHKIRARFRKALRWPVGSGFAFAKEVSHPGTEGRFFLRNAVDKITPEFAAEIVPQAIELAFVQAGFERG